MSVRCREWDFSTYALTQDIDKGVGQQVAVFVGGVTLVDSTGSNLNLCEYDGVILHCPAGIAGRV